MFVDASGEKVLHQAGLDALLFGDQGFGLLDGAVYSGQNFRDFSLFLLRNCWHFEETKERRRNTLLTC